MSKFLITTLKHVTYFSESTTLSTFTFSQLFGGGHYYFCFQTSLLAAQVILSSLTFLKDSTIDSAFAIDQIRFFFFSRTTIYSLQSKVLIVKLQLTPHKFQFAIEARIATTWLCHKCALLEDWLLVESFSKFSLPFCNPTKHET